MRPLAGLTLQNAPREVLAGITLIALAVPLNIGYAQIAGLPPTAGLYALVVPSVLYALVASSRQWSPRPMPLRQPWSHRRSAARRGWLCGLPRLGHGSGDNLRSTFPALGSLSPPFLGQLSLHANPGWLRRRPRTRHSGVSSRQDAGSQHRLGSRLRQQDRSDCPAPSAGQPWAVLISVAALTVLLVGRRVWSAVPWELLVLIGATLVVMVMGLDSAGVAVLGTVPAGPPALAWPQLEWR